MAHLTQQLLKGQCSRTLTQWGRQSQDQDYGKVIHVKCNDNIPSTALSLNGSSVIEIILSWPALLWQA